MVEVHEGARTVVDRLTADCHIIGVHHSMDEPDQHPVTDELRLIPDYRFQECQVFFIPGKFLQFRIVPADCVIRKRSDIRLIAGPYCILECSDTQVTHRHAGQYASRQNFLPGYPFSGCYDRKAPRRPDTEGMHRFTDDVFPQHRTDWGTTVTRP